MTIDEQELENLRTKVANQQGARALASPLYFIVQQIALIVALNFAFPIILDVSWQGNYAIQALFVFIYAIVYSIFGILFLAFFGFLSNFVGRHEGLRSNKRRQNKFTGRRSQYSL